MPAGASQATLRRTCDVLVIGGGPAGSSAALRLARRGFDVVQLERRHYGAARNDALRSGEALPPSTLGQLDALLRVTERSWALGAITQLQTHWPDGRTTCDHFPERTQLTLVDRERFDSVLADAALAGGADVRQGWQVRELRCGRDGSIEGALAVSPAGEHTPITARLVIDAGGRNARSVTQFGLRRPAGGTCFLVVALYLDTVPDLDPQCWELHLIGRRRLAVLQITQLAPGLVRCALGVDIRERDGWEQRRPEDLFWRIAAEHAALHTRLRTGRQVRPLYTRAGLAYTVQHIALSGLMLVGDATGYLSPLLGDGIRSALRSAALASAVAEQALHTGDTSRRVLACYERRWRAERRVRWAIGRALLQGYNHPALLSAPEHLAWLRRWLLRALLRP